MTRNMDNFGSEDMALPELKLGQPTGEKPEGANPGDFFVTITGDIYPEGLNIIIVDIQKNRTYWGRTDLDNEPPLCSSVDMITGQDGKVCETCEFRCDTPWLVDATARRSKCLVHYNLMVIDYDTKMPMILRASGISTSSVKEIFTLLRINKQLKGQYERAIIRLVSEKKKTASGEAWMMKFKLASIVNDANEAAELRELAGQILGENLLPEGTESVPESNQIANTGREVQEISSGDVGKIINPSQTGTKPVSSGTKPLQSVTKTTSGGKIASPSSPVSEAPVNLDF
ncbi:MAG: hypothetical protein WC554_06720 [Clostridia bacterium]